MDSKKSNKIRDIVRLQQILKKWKNKANASKSNNNNVNTTALTTSSSSSALSSSSSSSSTIKFLKRTLSFQDVSGAASSDSVPKGFLAVHCVGKEGSNKRFTIPTEYLSHRVFVMLLREAEEEFGFHQEGVLKIPCEVTVFEKLLKMVEEKREVNYFFLAASSDDDHFGYASSDKDTSNGFCFSPPSDCDLTPHHPQMCR